MLHLLQSEFNPPSTAFASTLSTCTELGTAFASTSTDPIAPSVAPSKSPCTPYNSVQKPTDFSYRKFYVTPLSTSSAPIAPSTSTANAPCIAPCNTSYSSTSTSTSTANHIALSIEENLTKTHCAIDSMQLWIPVATRTMTKRQFEKATPIQLIDCHYDKELLNDALLLASTGAVVRENPPYIHNDKHLSYQTGYAFKQMSVGNQAVSYISIGLHSKLLGTDYFKSINQQTIFKLWQAIQEQGVINITYANFLQCHVHQVDLKTDSIQDNVNASLDLIEANIREGRSFKRFDKEMNQGIQVGSRKENQVSIHFYNKALQFFNDSKSSIFLEKILKFNHPANILRTEITLYSKQLHEDFNIACEKLFHPVSQLNLANILNKVELMGQLVMKKHLMKIFNPQSINHVKPCQDKSESDSRLHEQVKLAVSLCLTSSMTLEDTKIVVCQLLQPGRDKKREVLRLVEHFYIVQTKCIDLDDEVKQVINF